MLYGVRDDFIRAGFFFLGGGKCSVFHKWKDFVIVLFIQYGVLRTKTGPWMYVPLGTCAVHAPSILTAIHTYRHDMYKYEGKLR